MGEVLDHGQAHEAGTAFDRVGGAENLVDQVFVDVRTPFFDGQEIVFDIGEVLNRFFYERLEDFIVFA
jgi:hypothetical protein